MTAEGHIIFALASTILAKKMELSSALVYGDWWHIISGGILTCLLPDIDHPSSILGQRMKWISKRIARLFGHRGFTHSLLIIYCIILFIYPFYEELLIPIDVFHGMIIGYISHIIADMFTQSGVPLFWPYRRRFRLPILISSNTFQRKKIERIACIIILIFAFQHHEKQFPLFCTFTVYEIIQFLFKIIKKYFFTILNL